MKIMSKLQSRKEDLRKDNKGFSLVELIIVIAIMAILVGVVGTQVIPYIEKSRKAKDIQVLSGLCTDATTAYTSNAATLTGTTYAIKIDSTGVTCADATLLAAFKELNSYTKLADLKLESKAGKDIKQIDITISDSTGVQVKITNTTPATYKFDDIKTK